MPECACNCHKDWWDGPKHANCEECIGDAADAERQMTVREIRTRFNNLERWKEFGIPPDVQDVLKDSEGPFNA